MSNRYFHSTSLTALDQLAKDLPQSVMISGPEGIGLSAAVEYLAEKLNVQSMIVLPERDEKIDLEKGTITVERVRSLYDYTRSKTTGKRLVVIDYAERMRQTAQNAFLKLLEEPTPHTHYVLLTHAPQLLLPTIRSRVEIHELRPITKQQSEALLDELKVSDQRKRIQLLFIAGSLPAELTRLVQDEAYFASRSEVVRDARDFLQGTPYQRLLLADKYREDRQKALVLLDDTAKLLSQNLSSKDSYELVSKIDRLLNAYQRIEQNGNVRLILADIVLQ